MAFPAGLTLVTVRCKFDVPPDGGATGRVRFEAERPLFGPADDSIVPPFVRAVELDETGLGTIQLPATNDPQWTPVDWTYRVVVSVGGAVFRGTLQLDYQDTSAELADLMQVDGAAVQGVTYATLAQLQEALDGVATLPVAIADVTGLQTALGGKQPTGNYVVAGTIDIADVNDLDTQLAGKQPAGTYLVPADIDNLVSSETLEEGLNARLPKVAPEIVDGTFIIRKTGWSSALRFRSTGGAVDIDKSNGDVVISSFVGTPEDTFEPGTQTGLARLRADGVTLAAMTQFGNDQYGSQQSIDGAGFVANLGAKNGATNLKFAGYLDISGAPVTGTWATGEIVMTKTGLYRCTAGGTPGTWFLYSTDQQVFHATEAGYGGWSYDGSETQAGTILPTGGLSYVVRMRIFSATVSAVNLHLTEAGAGLTNAFASLHNDAGVRLSATAVTANQNTNLQTGGERTMPLAAVQNVTPGDFYKIRFWATGTTMPTLSRKCNSSTAIVNAGLVAPNFRWATADAGLTDAASAPATIGTLTGGPTAWWLAVKP